ncbi:MAG: hypothetical protein V3S33_08425 [Gammaproteobacteria bacterium]
MAKSRASQQDNIVCFQKQGKSTIDMAMRAAWGDESVFNMSPPADEREDLRFMQKRYPVLDKPRG